MTEVINHGTHITVKKKSNLTGKTNEMIIPSEEGKILLWVNSDVQELIQDCFPELSNDEREFLLTGITPEEWDAAFGEDEEGIKRIQQPR